LELDSTFALAYTGLADIYWEKYYWKTFLSDNFLDSVIILTSKSITFDGQCAEAYYLRGAGYFHLGKPTEADKDLDKAIRYNPNNWKAYSVQSLISRDLFHDFVGAISNKREAILRNRGAGLPDLMADMGVSFIDIGFPESGKEYLKQALELDGDSSRYLKWIRYAELWSGNFEKAYQLAKNAYQRDSNSVTDMNTFCVMTGRNKEAYYHFEKLDKKLKKTGEIHPWASQGIGYTFWLEGRIQEANIYFDQQIKISLESIRLGRWNAIQKQAQWDLAKVYAFTGNKEKAYFYLDEVNKNNAFPLWWVTLFKYDPLLESIRNEPRFQKILQDVETKYQALHNPKITRRLQYFLML
jgi:tetratricopeptide (TPR) repeat protein